MRRIPVEAKAFIDRLDREQLFALVGSWAWLVADRTGDFQEFIGRPMTKWDAIRQRTKVFIEAEKDVPEDGPDQPIVDLMRDLLLGLAADGEDVPRMLTWAMSVDEYVLFGIVPDRWGGSEQDWESEITSWSDGSEGSLQKRIYDSFVQEVLGPEKRIREVRMAGYNDKDDWCNDPSLRSEWDQVLWDWTLGRIWIEPAYYVLPGFGRMMRREWWRRWRERLGPIDAALIGAPLENRYGPPRSLDEVTSINILPPFDTVAAPPIGKTRA